MIGYRILDYKLVLEFAACGCKIFITFYSVGGLFTRG